METTPKFYLVEASALPEIFLKVAETKHLLETGMAKTVNDATQLTGISRSAFYKYRESVFPFQNLMSGRIITFHMMLRDEPGCLSTLLSIFAKQGANILTINQTIPAGGCAGVTISSETIHMQCSVEQLLQNISGVPGVIKVEVLAG